MKSARFVSVAAVTFSLFAQVSQARSSTTSPLVRPYLALMSVGQTRDLLQVRLADLNAAKLLISPDQQKVLDAGQRVFDWINFLNQNRSGQPALSYSNPGNMSGPTMEHPKTYDSQTGVVRFADVVKDMPPVYLDIVKSHSAFPATLPLSEAQFLDLGFRVTLAYDVTARWIMMQDWLSELGSERVRDVRAYHDLSTLADRDAQFANFKNLAKDQHEKIRTELVGVCLNSQTPDHLDEAACTADVDQAIKADRLKNYYDQIAPAAADLYASFFALHTWGVRTDITWTAKDPQTIHYPFLIIVDPSVAAYFKDNVEDEWKGANWHLSIDFTQSGPSDLSHLEFQPHTTPHADENKIVMDEYEPRTEYLSQWTIRHEFGHLLGFKDCYVEFYDSKVKQIINYPLDPTNLMCSRRGHLQPQHFEVLKAAYYKAP